jgi:hypothetical protein
MPDRTPKPDGASEHPALPADYTGADRRAPTGGTALSAAVGAAAGAAAGTAANKEPEYMRGWPQWAKLLWYQGPFAIICIIFLGGVTCVAQERAADRANDRADRMEEREIRRAEAAQYQRQNDVVATKFDALVAKIDAALERANTSKLSIERIERELTDALEKLFAELKRLVPYRKPTMGADADLDLEGFLNPIWWLADHAPPKVMPALAPSPRPCETTGSESR